MSADVAVSESTAKRAAAWLYAREAFRHGLPLLPDDRVLAGQLAAQTYGLASSGAVQITPRDKMRNSPNRADALVVALGAFASRRRGRRRGASSASAGRCRCNPDRGRQRCASRGTTAG